MSPTEKNQKNQKYETFLNDRSFLLLKKSFAEYDFESRKAFKEDDNSDNLEDTNNSPLEVSSFVKHSESVFSFLTKPDLIKFLTFIIQKRVSLPDRLRLGSDLQPASIEKRTKHLRQLEYLEAGIIEELSQRKSRLIKAQLNHPNCAIKTKPIDKPSWEPKVSKKETKIKVSKTETKVSNTKDKIIFTDSSGIEITFPYQIRKNKLFIFAQKRG